MAAMTAITGLGHPIQQLSSCLFPDDSGRIDLPSDENRKRAKLYWQQQMQSLQTKMVLLNILENALEAIATGKNSILAGLLYEKDYVNLNSTAPDYGEKGLDAVNLTGVVKEVFAILLYCELKPRIEPWIDGDEPSNFALYISW